MEHPGVLLRIGPIGAQQVENITTWRPASRLLNPADCPDFLALFTVRKPISRVASTPSSCCSARASKAFCDGLHVGSTRWSLRTTKPYHWFLGLHLAVVSRWSWNRRSCTTMNVYDFTIYHRRWCVPVPWLMVVAGMHQAALHLHSYSVQSRRGQRHGARPRFLFFPASNWDDGMPCATPGMIEIISWANIERYYVILFRIVLTLKLWYIFVHSTAQEAI